MRSDWQQTALGNLLELANGKTSPERQEGLPYPVYGSNGIIGFADEFNAFPDTIIIGRVGSYCGSLQLSQSRCWVTDNAIHASASPGHNPIYLYYLLSNLDLNNWRTGSGQPLLNQTILNSIEVIVPPLPEQRAIAHILGSLDDKIELNRQMNATLEGIARALFKSWFVDFDPVHARRGECESTLPPEVLALFPADFEESELGLVPRGWEVKLAGKVVKAVGGTTPRTKNPDYWENGIHYFATPKHLSALSSPVLFGTDRKVTDEGLAKISSGLLPIGTVLLSSRAPVGYLALTAEPVCINQGFIAMICNGPVSNYYMLNWADAYMNIIKGRASGTTFAEISKRNFRKIPILVPTPKVVQAFDDFVAYLYEGIELNERQSRTLAELRDTLLPRLISGELRVPERSGQD